MNPTDDDEGPGPVIRLLLHGYPRLEARGRPVELPLRGGLALIARLAVEPGRLSRSAAAALLWPDAGTTLARGRLRRLMHDVNRRLGVDLIAGDADTVWLDAERHALIVDWVETRRVARRAILDRGVSPDDARPLLRRDAHRLLDGFALDTDTFDEWLHASRREHAVQVAAALERLVAQWLDQGLTAAALAAAERLVRIDPFAEAGYACLMAARGRLGDAAGVAAAYFEGAAMLRHELGVRPSRTFERVHADAMAQCARPADLPAFAGLLSPAARAGARTPAPADRGIAAHA